MPSVATKPLRAVLLDVGETIMRPSPSWEHIYAMALGEYGFTVDLEALRDGLRDAYHHGGWGTDRGFQPSEETSFRRTVELDQMAISGMGLPPMPEAFFRRLSELFLVTSHWHVFPDVMPTLDALRTRQLTLGVVSNWVWSLPELLHSLELVSHFSFIAASARVGYEKPHRAIFEYALGQAHAAPDEAMHVGDHLDADVQGALAAGITPVLIDRAKRHSLDELPPGIALIHSLDELVPIVDRRLGSRRVAAG